MKRLQFLLIWGTVVNMQKTIRDNLKFLCLQQVFAPWVASLVCMCVTNNILNIFLTRHTQEKGIFISVLIDQINLLVILLPYFRMNAYRKGGIYKHQGINDSFRVGCLHMHATCNCVFCSCCLLALQKLALIILTFFRSMLELGSFPFSFCFLKLQ